MPISTNSDAAGERCDVAIVGADPAGLVAAYLLTRAGRSVTLVESALADVGGYARTLVDHDCRFEAIALDFASQDERVAAMWEDLFPDSLASRRRTFRAHRGDALAEVADSAHTPEAELGPLDLARERFTDFKRWAGFEPGLVASPDISNRGERAAGCRSDIESRAVAYPQRGAATAWDTLSGAIVASGRGRVLLGQNLEQLAADGAGGWRLALRGPNGDTVVAATHTIHTAPLRDLVTRIHPLPQSALKAETLHFRDVASVVLHLRGPSPFGHAAVEVNDPTLKVARVRNLRPWSCDLLPDAHRQCVIMDYVRGDDGAWDLGEERLTYLAMAELQALRLGDLRNVDGSSVLRHEKLVPVEDADSVAAVAEIRAELAERYPTLHLAGRMGLHREATLDREIVAAFDIVETILAGAPAYERPVTSDSEGQAGVALPVLGDTPIRRAA